MTLRCDNPAIGPDEQNLAFRAAREFLNEFRVNAAVWLELHKETPLAAGLGGGSSDAGAVLRMIASLCGMDGASRLAALALRLGADVPYFLRPVAARVGGIGERISFVPFSAKFHLVIAVPPLEVSTATVFRELRPEDWSGRAPDEHVAAIAGGHLEPAYLVNDLERVATEKWPQIGELRRIIKNSGAKAASMTGSGGGVFGVFESSGHAEQAAGVVRREAPDASVFVATTV